MFIVGKMSTGTFTILPCTNFCDPHGKFQICMNGILGETRLSFSGHSSCSGGL